MKALETERVAAAKKYGQPVAPDTYRLPDLPDGWCCATVDQVIFVQGGLTKGKKRERSEEISEVPYLRVANVQRMFLDLDEIKTIQATKEEVDQLRLRPGDVLFSDGGDRDKLGRGLERRNRSLYPPESRFQGKAGGGITPTRRSSSGTRRAECRAQRDRRSK